MAAPPKRSRETILDLSTGLHQRRAAPSPNGGGALEPGAVLAMLDHPGARELPPEAASAWDAAWIACLTNSPRWAEAARREFATVVGLAGLDARRRA